MHLTIAFNLTIYAKNWIVISREVSVYNSFKLLIP